MTSQQPLLSALSEIVVRVRDLPAASQAYECLLGRSPTLADATGSVFALANCALRLLCCEGGGAEGVAALGFATRDLERARDALERRGLRSAPPKIANPRPNRCSELSREGTRQIPISLLEQVEPALGLSPVSDGQGGVIEEAAAVRVLDHTVVMSDDLDATKEVYGTGLGLRLALDKTFPKRGVRLLFFRVGGATVEIGGPLAGDGPRGRHELGGREPAGRDRFGGLAWQVPDAGAAHARLEKLGFELNAVRDGHKPGTRVFSVKSGTHGVPTLVIEPVSSL